MAADIYSKAGADAAFLHDTVAGRKALAQSPEINGTFVMFLNKDGTPVQNKIVAITLSADGTGIDDIAVYGSVGEVGAS